MNQRASDKPSFYEHGPVTVSRKTMKQFID